LVARLVLFGLLATLAACGALATVIVAGLDVPGRLGFFVGVGGGLTTLLVHHRGVRRHAHRHAAREGGVADKPDRGRDCHQQGCTQGDEDGFHAVPSMVGVDHCPFLLLGWYVAQSDRGSSA
jgi:hypothetical protein